MIRKFVVALVCVSFLAPIGAMFAPINRPAANKPLVTAVAPSTSSSTSSPAPITTRTS